MKMLKNEMKMLRTWMLGLLSMVVTGIMAADYTID